MPEQPADDPAIATELAPGAVRRERDLPVPAEDAWSLLEDAEGLSRWLADDVEVLVAPGEFGTLRDGDERRSVLIEEVEDGRRVALRWWSDDAPGDGALVDLTLEPNGDDRSRLIVTEVPLRVVTAPDTFPASWTLPGTSGPAADPQLARSGSATGRRLALAGAA